MKGLSGLRVLVAGSSGGIGREVVRQLAQRGAVIGAHYYRSAPGLDGSAGPARLKSFKADLSRPEPAAKLVAAFARWAGGIDALVQLTGDIHAADIFEVTPAQWRAELEMNLTAPFFLAREAMARMRRAGRVVLAGTASVPHGGGRDTMAYGAAKAGIECVVKGLARVGAPRGILVNAVCPGFIATGFHTVRLGKDAAAMSRRAALVPLKRAGTPAEVAGPVLFLLSEQASYITGQCIAISGGDWL
ncbi:MAG: SDR family oxidoreductase [Elusimicrobia bacterium]|nr:SDR family oxidoreductase [Elusimicrobiota bacterium]